MELDGRVALVTGAASGIGRATARRLATAGMRLALVDVDPDGLAAVAAEVGGLVVVADCADSTAVDAAVDHTVAELGGLDLAYLNAGIAIGIPDPLEVDDATFRRIMAINVDGVFFGVRAAVRTLRAQGRGGVILATASLAGLIPFPPDPVYDATKHAVVGLVRSLAPTLAADGIAVHAICPGLTDTNILGPETKEALAAGGFPLMEATQIADAVVTAATSDRTGTCWVCQPGIPPTPYAFRDVPGPRTEGAEGAVPPSLRDDGPGIFRR